MKYFVGSIRKCFGIKNPRFFNKKTGDIFKDITNSYYTFSGTMNGAL